MALQPADPYETEKEREERLIREAAAKKAAPGGALAGGATGALGGASTGAALGSVVPGIGTAIGAGLGAVVGGISGAVKGGQQASQQAQEKAGGLQPSAGLQPVSAPTSLAPAGQATVTPAASPPQATVTPRGPNPLVSSLGGIGKTPGSAFKDNPVGAVGAGLDVAQSIGDLLPNSYERRNNQQIGKLQTKEAAGNMGLDPRERSVMNQRLMNPVREGITELGNMQAGMTSPAQMASARRDSARAIAGASQNAVGQVEMADLDAARGNRAELEQRMATRAAGGEQNRANIAGRIGDAVAAESAKAGDVPLNIMGPYGSAVKDTGQARRVMTDLGVPPELIQQVMAQPPEFIEKLFADLGQPPQPMMGG